MRKQTTRLMTLAMGIFAALVILFSHSFTYQSEEQAKKQENQEQTDTEASVQAAPATVASPQASLQTDSEPSVIQNWVREVGQKARTIVAETVTLVFRHLVGTSISPQAP